MFYSHLECVCNSSFHGRLVKTQAPDWQLGPWYISYTVWVNPFLVVILYAGVRTALSMKGLKVQIWPRSMTSRNIRPNISKTSRQQAASGRHLEAVCAASWSFIDPRVKLASLTHVLRTAELVGSHRIWTGFYRCFFKHFYLHETRSRWALVLLIKLFLGGIEKGIWFYEPDKIRPHTLLKW